MKILKINKQGREEVDKYIKKIFTLNSQILNYSDKTITYIRIQNYYRALRFSSKAIEIIIDVIENIINNSSYFNEESTIVDINHINQMLSGVLEAQDNFDYIMLADLYELQLIPFILCLQDVIMNKEPLEYDTEQYKTNLKLIQNKDYKLYELLKKQSIDDVMDKGYSLEYTSCGLPTLAMYDNEKKYYLHSNGQIQREAGVLARDWFSDEKSEYIIYGLGLGYHIMELLDLNDTIEVKVFESDLNIVNLALAFSDMEKILNSDRVQIIYDPNFIYLSKETQNISKDTCYVIHYPSIRSIKDNIIKTQLEDYFVSYSSIKNQLHNLNNNFKKNILHRDESIDVIRDQFVGKDIFIIAAGPSLDKNYKRLKEIGKNSIILSTGTVYKKLLKSGIKPDYFIIIDANPAVYTQIEGIEESTVPLIYLSTVYNKIVGNYKGNKYIVLQKGYYKAEKYAVEKGYTLFNTGGSVSTTALDIALQFNCKRVIFLGLDLAYTNNQDHAVDTVAINEVTSENYRMVKDIYGNDVSASKSLDIYRKWIENRIRDIKDIEIIDATEGGAKVSGMKIFTMNEIILTQNMGYKE